MTPTASIVRNRLEGGRLAGLGLDEEAGYAAQAAANRELELALGRVVGHKIGATAAGMRQLLNVPGPIAGDVFKATVHEGEATFRLADYRRPGIETEIAVRVARDLLPEEAPWTIERIAREVSEVMAAIELVDDRYADFAAGAGTIIADNAFNAGSVLGLPASGWRSLALDALKATTIIDGKPIATGLSSELLGHPLAALVWLADRYAGLGRPLKAGRFVSLGTITPVQWIDKPCKVEIEIEGLGGVKVAFV